MPRKNKKKQRKEERRRAVQRVRQETGWQPPPDVDFREDELMRDMLMSLPGGEDDGLLGVTAEETMIAAALDSDDLFDEPEFREMYFHPMQALDVYAEVEEKRGITEDKLDALSPDEEDELFTDLMEELAQRLLTEEMVAKILEAAETAWKRVRQEGDQERAGRLAAVLWLLEDGDAGDMWSGIGLIQAILHRSLEAGFEIASVFEADDPGVSGRERWLLGMDQRLQEQVEAIVAKYPGLDAVLVADDEEEWHEVIGALMEGELFVGFFSDAELEQAAEMITPEKVGAELSDEEQAQAGIRAIRQYISSLLTLERRAEMREQLLTILEDVDLAAEYGGFFTAMLYDLDNEDPESALVVLTAAMLGELGDMADASNEEAAD